MPWRWRFAALSLVPLLAAAVGIRAQAADSPLCNVAAPATAGLSNIQSTRPDLANQQFVRWTFDSQAMHRSTTVNVLEPPHLDRAYEVLFLLHGHGGNADEWWTKRGTNDDSLAKIVGTRQLLVVMPEGGYDGWYSDWYGTDVDGHNGAVAPGWETFHTTELMNFIDSQYGRGTARMIAGLSMGGYGAMIYAERHPKLFTAVGSFSGALDTQLDDPLEPEIQPFAQNGPDRKEPDFCIWGDGVLQHENWTKHNPTANVGALQNMRVYTSSGDGCAPSAANPDPQAPITCAQRNMLSPDKAGALFTEWGVRQQNESFRTALLAQRGRNNANTRFDFYSPGDHSWPYWLGELRKFLDWVLPAGHS